MTDESYENAVASPWFWDLSIGDQVWIVGGVRMVEIFRDRLSDLSDDFDEAQILQASTPAEAAETARRLETKFKAQWTLSYPDHPDPLSNLGRAITLASIIAETIEENFPSAAMIAFAAGRPVPLGPFPPSETADLYCRICGYDPGRPTWTGYNTDWSICPCCSVEWGYEDSTLESIIDYRLAWLRGGAVWAWEDQQHDGLTTEERLHHIGIALLPNDPDRPWIDSAFNPVWGSKS